jgi:uncharacterized protein with ParB-like and HNH nuclease domain
MAGIKVKDFFNGRFFEIPKYQRGYAWEKSNIRDLFDDVVEAVESNSNHYIGTIVLSKDDQDDEKFYVVDGQQRITTITLMMSALIKQLSPRDADFYERVYLKEEDRYRLQPLNRDNKFFVDLLGGTVGDPQNKSQRFLTDAEEEIKYKVEGISDKLKFLKALEKLEVMEFVENSEGDAIRIFQTVNDRGKPLSNMEKAKSLLIYFSNRYLGKKLDTKINDHFSDVFEIYDDIKHIGEELNITLIRNKDFNEDNLMRYHFTTFSEEDYDPSATYVFQFLKNNLTVLRNAAEDNYDELEDFINSYITSIKEFFSACREVIQRAQTKEKYYKLFVVLNLSATLYPLIAKLEMLGLLDQHLPSEDKKAYTFLDLIELIDVRVYKTRGTDPKADVARFVSYIDQKTPEEIEGWFRWFNERWMTKEMFQSYLWGSGVYGNRALNHIFISYSETVSGKKYGMKELKKLVSKVPNVEHILSQTPKFSARALGFRNTEEFLNMENCLGNLTGLEKALNSAGLNKSALDKTEYYGKSDFSMTKKLGTEIHTNKGFTKKQVSERTIELGTFCLETWWA